MATTFIIILSTLLLLAYAFDLTSSRTRIPSVILLLFLGWVLKQITTGLELTVPDLTPALPVLGTVGLILIVLEGSLEIEFSKSRSRLIGKSFLMALLPMLLLSFGIAWVLQLCGYAAFKINLANAIPLSVISSAIAIPSVRGLTRANREFVIYESSFSDILGVLFFNFVTLNESFGVITFGHFSLELLLIIVASFGATLVLAFLLNKIEHHVKFVPIILLVILIYAISKVYHLPGLIFILIFGLFIGNLDELRHVRWIQRFNPVGLDREVHKFKDLTIEGAFLVRSVFFILFGYLIDSSELFNPNTIPWAVAVTAAIFLLRAIHLWIFGLPRSPLLFLAPRGLITILLFLSLDAGAYIAPINRSLIIQVIILSALVMMIGLMSHRVVHPPEPEQEAVDGEEFFR